MLIMGQTDGICPQFLDYLRIIVVILSGQGISLIQKILMTADAP